MDSFTAHPDDERTGLLIRLVREMTDNGECIEGMTNMRHRADLAWWLEQRNRHDDARAVTEIDDFTLTYGPSETTVYIHVHGTMREVPLVTFGEPQPDATD